MLSYLVCLWGCRGALCRCSGCCDCDACTVVCVACVYAEREWEWRQCWCGGWMSCGCGEYRACVWYTWLRYCVLRSFCAVDECGGWNERRWWSMWDVYVFGSGRRGWRGEWGDERIGFGRYQSCGNWVSVGRVSVFALQWCGWCRWGVGRGLDQVWRGGVVLCLCELWVWIHCVDGRSRYLYIVLGGYLCILGAPSVQSCCTICISAPYHVFVYVRYRKSRLVCVWLSDPDLSRNHPLLWGAAPSKQRVCMTRLPKNGKSGPIAGGGRVWHILHSSLWPLWQLHRL